MRVVAIAVGFCFLLCTGAYASPSAIVEAEGHSCMGVDKSRKQTEQEARADAKRNAVENAQTYVRSQTQVQDFQLEKDFIEAYAGATVTILEDLKAGSGWFKDADAGDCYHLRIKAEVIPDEKTLTEASKKLYSNPDTDPAAPLNVRVSTDRSDYRRGDRIRVYLQGNKPFYARVLYKDASGQFLQILPNPYRKENYFQGGVIYEIPSGDDRFLMIVTPPFGAERIVVHASTSPLGDIDLEGAGAVYEVRTHSADIGAKSRGVKLISGSAPDKPTGAEFTESQADLKTGK